MAFKLQVIDSIDAVQSDLMRAHSLFCHVLFGCVWCGCRDIKIVCSALISVTILFGISSLFGGLVLITA